MPSGSGDDRLAAVELDHPRDAGHHVRAAEPQREAVVEEPAGQVAGDDVAGEVELVPLSQRRSASS